MQYGYIIAFAATVLGSLFLTRCVRNVAVERGWVTPPASDRHVHSTPVPRLGGVAVFLATICVVGAALLFPRVFDSPSELPVRVAGILGPAAIIFLLGLFDDLCPLGAPVKLLGQTVAAVLLYVNGFGVYQIDLLGNHVLRHFVALPLTIFWVLLITNAFNLIDGLDGLASGSALFSTLVVFVVSLFLSNHLISFLAVVLAGAILGFLPFNIGPATIFLGDSGSLFIGFLLSALGLAGSQKAQTMVAVAIPVVSFGLPILDVGLALMRRFMNDKPLFIGDREHIHHKLLDRGFSQREVVLILYCVTAGFGLLSLALLHGQDFFAVVLAVVGSSVCFGVQRLRYHEFSELQRVARRTLGQKQIMASNLKIRHATESLRRCADYPLLLKILRETFIPLGFDGFAVAFPPGVDTHEIFSRSRNNGYDGYDQHWSVGVTSNAAWALQLFLITTSGDPCGLFWLHRNTSDKPLLLDINLLIGEFQVALADAVQRALVSAKPAAEEPEPKEVEVGVRAGSF
jgi:UDP-GlcNAc:undecaprenyl-phosphate/decaprenyl-phosphate GlcNAc-1-phosphate transferase